MKKIKHRKHGNEKKNIHLFLTCQKYPEVSNEKNKWAEPSGRKTAKFREGEFLKAWCHCCRFLVSCMRGRWFPTEPARHLPLLACKYRQKSGHAYNWAWRTTETFLSFSVLNSPALQAEAFCVSDSFSSRI